MSVGDLTPGELYRLLAEGEADVAAERVARGEEFFEEHRIRLENRRNV